MDERYVQFIPNRVIVNPEEAFAKRAQILAGDRNEIENMVQFG